MKGRVLIVAGSDSGGGAGIQADVKTVTALGGYAATAITALTAQNTVGVQGIHAVPLPFLRLQMASMLGDIGADAIKTGMLGEAATIVCVCDVLAGSAPDIPLVVDPVMVAKGGERLLTPDAVGVLKSRLLPMGRVITPNVPEAEALTGLAIPDRDAMRPAAATLLRAGARAVLLKGGHLTGDTVVDLLATEDGIEEFASPRIQTRHTHGTGCTLASAIAIGLAQGLSLRQAILRARAYVLAAIRSAPGFGAGHGPLDHAVTSDPSRLRHLS